MNTENYRDVFLEEAEENVRNINFSLLELEKTPSDLGHVNELFRAAHTLKGMSATMGYDKLAGFTHVLEDLLDRVRSGVLRAGQDVINMLFKSADIITGFIENIKERNLDFSDGHGEATEAIKRIIDKGSAAGGSMAESFETGPEEKAGEESGAPGIEVEEFLLQEAQARELKVFLIRVYLVKTCAFKNVRAFMATRNLSEKGEIIKSNPAAKEIEEGDFGSFFELAFVTKEEKDAVVSSISRIAEIDRIEIKELKSAGMEEKKAEEEGKGAAARETGSGKKSQVSQSVRVNLEKIDSMMNLVGELVITKIRLGQITKEKNYEKLRDTVEEFDRIIDSLQMEVTDVRMLPVAHIFDRYPRLVRDIAAQAGKQVELEVFGSDIEIDRTVLEEINEPVMHLLRNSIAHGIEDLAQREIKGKSKKGVIRLGARRERNSVIIEVSDDGSGINIEKVKKKAVEKGLLTPERSKAISDEEAANIVAMPGFSTAEITDEISGRGVGVDVVKTKVEGFGGVLKIENHPGEGVKFILKLPLTLAIIQALLVRAADSVYALPVINTTETIELPEGDIKTIQKKRVIILRGEVIPVKSLAELLKKPGPGGEIRTLVIAETGDRKVALEIDSVIGQQEVAIKSLGDFIKYARGFSGVTILGDGSISLIVDVQALLGEVTAEV